MTHKTYNAQGILFFYKGCCKLVSFHLKLFLDWFQYKRQPGATNILVQETVILISQNLLKMRKLRTLYVSIILSK